MQRLRADSGLLHRVFLNEDLSWEEIRNQVDIAFLSRSKGIEFDISDISENSHSLISELVRSKNLQLYFRFDASKRKSVDLKSLPDFTWNIYFSHSEDLSLVKDQFMGLPFANLILVGRTHTDFLNCYKLFSKKKNSNLFFHFPKYDAEDPLSLNVREVAKIIEKLRLHDSEFEAQSLTGIEVCNESDLRKTELSLSLMTPNFQKKTTQTNPPKISFIIPTHNSKFFLQNVIKHIVTQNCSKELFEIIVVDDGGKDLSGPFLQSYLETEKVDCNFKYIYWPKPTLKENEPPPFRPGIARNLGAYHSQGDYLVFLDSDILVPSNFVSDLLSHFQSHDVIQYVRHHIVPSKSNSYVTFTDVTEKKDLYIEEKKYWGPFFEVDRWMDLPFFWKYTCTYCLALRASDFFSLGGFRRSFISYGFEDTDLGFRLAKSGRRFHLSKLVTLHLTPQHLRFERFSGEHDRFLALSKTAKIFFLLNLDLDIYHHLYNYMGGEFSFSKYAEFYLEKFRKIFSKTKKASEVR